MKIQCKMFEKIENIEIENSENLKFFKKKLLCIVCKTLCGVVPTRCFRPV
jgi:hypothetical protein